MSVSEVVWLLPIATFPKPILDGAAVKEPGVTPVPESGTLSVGFDALLLNAIAPLALPLD